MKKGTSIIPLVINPAKTAGKIVNPTCLLKDNKPRAEPWSLEGEAMPTKTFKGAPSKNPNPTPAVILAIMKLVPEVTQSGNRLKPIAAIRPEIITVLAGPIRSANTPPTPAPTPDIRAKGVNQNPACSTGT